MPPTPGVNGIEAARDQHGRPPSEFLKEQWANFSSKPIQLRLFEGWMVRDTGNEHIENRNWELANMEYEFVVNLYNYEVLNRYTDLVDSFEITAEQWEEMDDQLLFCHTNSAFCYLEIARDEIKIENKKKPHLRTVPEGELPYKANEAIKKVLEHSRLGLACKPKDNAKAVYRMGQAFVLLKDYLEAFDCLSKAIAIEPGNPEIRAAMNELKAMPALEEQRARRKQRSKKVFGSLWKKQEMKNAMQGEHVHRIKERLLLMDLILQLGPAPSSSELRVFKTVKYFGKEVLEGDDLRLYEDMFKRAKTKMTEDQLQAGRELGVYVSPEEEHIFGPNVLHVAQHHRLPEGVGSCADLQCNAQCQECKEVCGLVKTIIDKGGLDSLSEEQVQKAAGWGLIVTSQWKAVETKSERKPGETSVCD